MEEDCRKTVKTSLQLMLWPMKENRCGQWRVIWETEIPLRHVIYAKKKRGWENRRKNISPKISKKRIDSLTRIIARSISAGKRRVTVRYSVDVRLYFYIFSTLFCNRLYCHHKRKAIGGTVIPKTLKNGLVLGRNQDSWGRIRKQLSKTFCYFEGWYVRRSERKKERRKLKRKEGKK